MEVILTPENEASLRDFVHGIIVDEIEKHEEIPQLISES